MYPRLCGDATRILAICRYENYIQAIPGNTRIYRIIPKRLMTRPQHFITKHTRVLVAAIYTKHTIKEQAVGSCHSVPIHRDGGYIAMVDLGTVCRYIGLVDMKQAIFQYQNSTINRIRLCDLNQVNTATDLVRRHNMKFSGYVDIIKTVPTKILPVPLPPVNTYQTGRYSYGDQ